MAGSPRNLEWTEVADGVHEPVGTLHHEFAGWLGDDLVTTSGFWLVSGRLADAIRASPLTGWTLAEVLVSKDEQWDATPQRDDFPERWERLVPTGSEAAGDDFAVQAHTDLLVSDDALALLREFRLEHAEVGDDTAPVISDVMASFLAERAAMGDRVGDGRADARVTRSDIPAPGIGSVAGPDAAAPATPTARAAGAGPALTVPSGTAVTGDVVTAIRALGAPSIDDGRARAVLALVGGEPTVEESQHPSRGVIVIHKVREHGLDVRFVDGTLDQVTFHLSSDAHRRGYPRPQAIIDGLPVPEASKEQVTALLGEPYQSLGPIMSRYRLGDGHVHFGWSRTGERTIVVLRTP